jgi:hypothetical protein
MSVYHVVLGLMLRRCTIIINLNFICLWTFPLESSKLVSLIDVESDTFSSGQHCS